MEFPVLPPEEFEEPFGCDASGRFFAEGVVLFEGVVLLEGVVPAGGVVPVELDVPGTG